MDAMSLRATAESRWREAGGEHIGVGGGWPGRPQPDVDGDGGDDGGRATARRRVDLLGASVVMIEEAGWWQGGSSPRCVRGWRGDRRSRSTRRRDTHSSRPARAWRRDDAAERRRSRATAASPNGIEACCGRSHDLRGHDAGDIRIRTGRFVTDHGCRVPMHIGKAMACSRRETWTARCG